MLPEKLCAPNHAKLDYNVADIMGPNNYKDSKYTTHVGLEFEWEFENSSHAVAAIGLLQSSKGWAVHSDESLAYGTSTEAVFSGPVAAKDAKNMIEKVFDAFKSKGVRFNNSNRCSTHIHLNMQDVTSLAVFKFLMVYYLIEDALFERFAPRRITNKFCIPLSRADFTINLLKSDLGYGYLTQSASHKLRYAAMNLNAIQKFGTLESRLLGGCDSPEDVFKLMSILLEIKKYVISTKDKPMSELFKQYGPKTMIYLFMEEMPITYQTIKELPTLPHLLRDGAWRSLEIINSVDWSKDAPRGRRRPPSPTMKSWAVSTAEVSQSILETA